MRHGEDDAREVGGMERQRRQRLEEERTRALERRHVKKELRARVEEREQRAAGEIEGTALDAEAQRRSRMGELYAREVAVRQPGL